VARVAAPETPPDSPLRLEDVMSSRAYGQLMTPAVSVGEPAFAFELPLLDPETHRPSGAHVRLGDFTGVRPVALVFGSYT
jgi:hypothetical protein